MIAYAASHTELAQGLVNKIESIILFPLMSFMLTLAFFLFLFGIYEFVANAESEEGRAKGKSHILYGIIGMLVMLSALAILKIAAATFGVTIPSK
jgi:hypothetical protein